MEINSWEIKESIQQAAGTKKIGVVVENRHRHNPILTSNKLKIVNLHDHNKGSMAQTVSKQGWNSGDTVGLPPTVWQYKKVAARFPG